ncbi:solute carrier family 25 member 36-like [Gordionus sp. m RMFG-2023]|uniref:solute carrier family 25 member 36-like n=1 Tax=Gordionus sp. m RMFG-2023 TaxID=3053472 RepID=UPI0031FC359F
MVSDSAVHLIAGGLAGTVATVLTCPLEVLKTRLQSSAYQTPFEQQYKYMLSSNQDPNFYKVSSQSQNAKFAINNNILKQKSKIYFLLRHTFQTEGLRGLFKGLVPNLIGVAPARSIYFCAYSNGKKYFNKKLKPDSPTVYILSASLAGFVTSTLTNPIWFIKTRLQLDQSTYQEIKLSALQCIKQTYRTDGIRGFYKGVTASYYGISETAINFLIYESIKKQILSQDDHLQLPNQPKKDINSTIRFLQLMLCAGVAKTFAATIAYPHEVARTRLREGKDKYRTFWKTLIVIAREEKYKGLYRGLLTHLIRQIPNTAITLATYETLAYFMTRKIHDNKAHKIPKQEILYQKNTLPIPDIAIHTSKTASKQQSSDLIDIDQKMNVLIED